MSSFPLKTKVWTLYLFLLTAYIRYMKRIFTLIVLVSVLIPLSLFSQSEFDPCGTPAGKSKWLKKYQQNPEAYETRLGDPILMPLTIFSVGDDTGLGAFSESNLLVALCQLKEDFLGTDIYFYMDSPIKYMYNSAYYEHGSVLDGAQMMFDNNIPNTINNYFVKDPAGNCGYNLPYAGVAMNKACSGPGDHTWAHEIGHNLSLPHPFLGWEGGVSHDGSVFHDYSDPAPDTIYYDYTYFKDTLILDTMIIDAIAVERMDGSNCHDAGDGFCDTAPDYLGFRWMCDNDGLSLQEQTDPSGEKFVSDGQWFMSYSFDNCATGFSGEQIDAMRANILDEKPDYIDPEVEMPGDIVDVPTLNYPLDEEMVAYSGLELDWTPVENATAYLVQLGFEPTVTAVLYDTLVYEDQVQLFNLNQDYKYYWRVMPINEFTFCTEFSEIDVFVTGDFVSTEETLYGSLDIIPNPINSGEGIYINNQTGLDISEVRIVNANGRAIHEFSQVNSLSEIYLTTGFYFCQIKMSDGTLLSEKLVVQ